MTTQIRIDAIEKRYSAGKKITEVLADINLTIEPGELFFLLGPSGCGKTTLLRIIAGLIEPTAGRIWFNNNDMTTTPVEKRDTAMVFQNYALWPHMTVAQNVQFGPKMRGIGAEKRTQISTEKLQLVQMEHYQSRKPNQLSGGQQQRVALARALAAEPACLLLDEPLSNLDAKLRAQMRTELRKLIKAGGATAIYVTHDQKEALSMADRIAILHQGCIAQVGAPETVYNAPANTFVADFVGEANFIDGVVKTNQRPYQVETPVGLLVSDSEKSFKAGDPVTCCARPERIGIATNSAASNPIVAQIDHLTYLGEIWQGTFRLKNNAIWKMTALQKPSINFSELITLTIATSDIVLLAR